VEIGDGQALLVGTWFDRAVPLTLGPQEPAFSGGKSQPPSPPEPSFRTGLKAVAPWWTVEGRWVEDAATEVMLGSALAGRLGVAVGDRIPLGVKGVTRTFQVAGIARTGGAEEDQVFVDLAAAQSLLGLPGKVDRVQVSALVKPDDALAIKGKRNPRGLSADEYERWYCSPYIDAVIYQIEEAFPGAQGKALRQVAEAEGGVLGRVTLTLFLVTAVAMVAASLGVMATMTTTVAERRGEIGLMKAIGAEPRQITRQLLLEAGLYGLLGGTAGAAAGCALARLVGVHVFHAAVVPSPVTVPFVIGLAVVVALLGAALPTRQAARLDPVCTLRGG
jgi:putative ABC transport system permease protein